MKIFLYPKDNYDACNTRPIHEICYFIGRILGKILLFGAGYCIGQVVRGLIQAFGIALPSLF